MSKLDTKVSRIINNKSLLILLLFSLAVRYLTIETTGGNPDSMNYVNAAKSIVLNYPYPQLAHRTTRFGIILPTALLYKVVGTHPITFYILPLFILFLSVIALFHMGKLYHSPVAGILAAIFFILFPGTIYASKQIMPGIFSALTVLLCIYMVFKYIDKNSILTLISLGILIFFSYSIVITNLFFVPGYCFIIWHSNKKIKPVLVIFATFLLLFLVESIVIFNISGELSRLNVILNSHLNSANTSLRPTTFLGLLNRFSPKYLPIHWQITFLVSFIIAIINIIHTKHKYIKYLSILMISFLFFTTFSVKSIDPIIPAQPFVSRYLFVVIGPTMLLIAMGLTQFLREKVPSLFYLEQNTVLFSFLCIILVTMFIVFAIDAPLKTNPMLYHNPTKLNENPIILTFQYFKTLNNSIINDIPIISEHAKRKGVKSLLAVHRLYLQDRFQKPGEIIITEEIYRNKRYVILKKYNSATSIKDSDRIILSQIYPFRVYKASKQEL